MFFYISVEIFISSHEGVGAFWNVLIRFVHSPQQDYILNEPLFCYIYRMSVLGVCYIFFIFQDLFVKRIPFDSWCRSFD